MTPLFESLEGRTLLSADALVADFPGLRVDGDVVRSTAEMAAIVAAADADAVYSQTSWNGENYWVQDSSGEVWAIWHGGNAHATEGGYNWFLTSISNATGAVEIFQIESMSGTFTPWRAFNILGLDSDGDVVTYWWSPQSGADRLGINGTGWVLTNLSDAADWSGTGGDQPTFTGRTEVVMKGQSIVISAVDTATGIALEIVHTPGVEGPTGEHWLSGYVDISLELYVEEALDGLESVDTFLRQLDDSNTRIEVLPNGDLRFEQYAFGDLLLASETFSIGLDVSVFGGDLPSFGNGDGDPEDVVRLMMAFIQSNDASAMESFFDTLFQLSFGF